MELSKLSKKYVDEMVDTVKTHFTTQRPMAWLNQQIQKKIDESFDAIELSNTVEFDAAIYEFIENNLTPEKISNSPTGTIDGNTFKIQSEQIDIYGQPLDVVLSRIHYWFLVNNDIDVIEFAAEEQRWLYRQKVITDLVETTKDVLCDPISSPHEIEVGESIYAALTGVKVDPSLNSLIAHSKLPEEKLNYISKKIRAYFDEDEI